MVFTLLLVVMTAAVRLPINSTECESFLQKFGQQYNEQSKLKMHGEVKIDNGDVSVIFQYYDSYFNTTYFGFVVEDGQLPENTCLDIRIHKYSDQNYIDPQLSDLTITGSKNETTQYRNYILKFKGDELKDRMIQSTSANYYLYSGYYALSFYLQGTEQSQFIHRFMFQIRVNRKTETISESFLNSITDKSVQSCQADPSCPVNIVSDLWFCVTSECKEFSATPPTNISLNDIFFMFQNTTSESLANYQYSDSKIYFLSSGLLKAATIISANYSIGNATYELKATIAWDKLQIQASTTLISQDGRRILTEYDGQDSVLATSNETCFTIGGQNKCPQCLDICNVNHDDAPEICSCLEFIQKIFLLILLVIF